MEHAPWIGERYAEGIDGQRLLLFGFSHYGTLDDGRDGPDFTNHVVRTWGLTGGIPFFKTLAGYFGTMPVEEFFQRIAFANTLPTSVGDEDDKYTAGDEAARAQVGDRVRRLIVEVDPDKVIVFTTKGWGLFPPFDDRAVDGQLAVAGRTPIPFGGYRRRRDGHALAYGLRHALFAPWEMMHHSVQAIMAARPEPTT